MLANEFPTVRLKRFNASAGWVVRRNEGAQLASAPILFSVDDDATFGDPYTISETLKRFENPVVGAIAMPFVNVRQDSYVHCQLSNSSASEEFYTFVGTAYAIRRNLFLALGGFREVLIGYLEESDFCIRLLDHGHFVQTVSTEPIQHFESPKRNNRRIAVLSYRNDVLFAALNVPWLALFPHLAVTTLKGLFKGFRRGHPLWAMEGLLRGYAAALANLCQRRPVKMTTYRQFRFLKRQELQRYKRYCCNSVRQQRRRA